MTQDEQPRGTAEGMYVPDPRRWRVLAVSLGFGMTLVAGGGLGD